MPWLSNGVNEKMILLGPLTPRILESLNHLHLQNVINLRLRAQFGLPLIDRLILKGLPDL
jgi:hypothetical protein